MPHYRDGTEARVGDHVRGKGYNVKGPDGKLCEIFGVLIELTPGAMTCNCKIAHIEVHDPITVPPHSPFLRTAESCLLAYLNDGRLRPLRLNTEYGQCDHFEKVG